MELICRYCCYNWPKCMSSIIDVSNFSFRVWKRAVCTADYECWQPSPCRQQQFWGVISKLAMTQTEIERERRHWQLDRVINAALETSYPTIPCVLQTNHNAFTLQNNTPWEWRTLPLVSETTEIEEYHNDIIVKPM